NDVRILRLISDVADCHVVVLAKLVINPGNEGLGVVWLRDTDVGCADLDRNPIDYGVLNAGEDWILRVDAVEKAELVEASSATSCRLRCRDSGRWGPQWDRLECCEACRGRNCN